MPPAALPAPPQGLGHYWLRRDWGWLHLVSGGQGPALWLVHGLGGSAHDFYALAPYLQERFTLLIPDLPGSGDSDKPDLAYSPRLFVEELAEVSVELGLESAFWLGHSMGGQIVLTQGLERPELTRAVVAVCPAGGHKRVGRLQRLALSLFARPDGHLRIYHRSLIALWIRNIYGDPNHPSRQELTRRVQAQWDSLEGPLVERSFVRAGRTLLEEPLWHRLDTMSVPVMMVGGRKDRITPARHVGRLLGHLPYGTPFHLLPCGHMPVYTRPQELALLVSGFLGEIA
ncbi:MAG: alpha/beta hydrolase [Desulfarculaceae bacterium]|nr:alpha/beta hydrolase [Desulfarculaceae bacterium]